MNVHGLETDVILQDGKMDDRLLEVHGLYDGTASSWGFILQIHLRSKMDSLFIFYEKPCVLFLEGLISPTT